MTSSAHNRRLLHDAATPYVEAVILCAALGPYGFSWASFSKTNPAGATFVTNQFWCSLMFSANVVGTANAHRSWLGELGRWCYPDFHDLGAVQSNGEFGNRCRHGLAGCNDCSCGPLPDSAQPPWNSCAGTRPLPNASMCLWLVKPRNHLCGTMWWCWKTSASLWWFFNTVHASALSSPWTTNWPPISRTYFQMDAADASALAGAFGLMNLFARSLGGIGKWRPSSSTSASEAAFGRNSWPFSLKPFSSSASVWWITPSHGMLLWPLSFASPFLSRWQKAQATQLCRSWTGSNWQWCLHVVGAGGNLGAVIAGFCFYKPINDPLLPFQVHAGYVMFWALLTPCYYWREHGGMFHGPAVKTSKAAVESTDPTV